MHLSSLLLLSLAYQYHGRPVSTSALKFHKDASSEAQNRLKTAHEFCRLLSVAEASVTGTRSPVKGLAGLLIVENALAFNHPRVQFPLGLAARTISHPVSVARISNQETPSFLAVVFDQLAKIRIDDKTEDEYWVFDLPFTSDSLEFLRKRTSLAEILIGGWVAGLVVEFAVALLCHPFDTVKSRLQAKPKKALERYPSFDDLYAGFGPVALTVPALSVFWATKDTVRKSIIAWTKEALPWPVLDVFSTGTGAALGEATYWLIKAPSEVLKTQKQVLALQKEEANEEESEHPDSSTLISMELTPGFTAKEIITEFTLWQAFKAWPTLAIADVPYVALRTAAFVAWHNSHLLGQDGFAEDTILFSVANVLAVLLTTPLDVVRTQMLLRGSSIQELPDVVRDVYTREGLFAFVAGWSPRLLYNGLIVGVAWGIVRQFYGDIRSTVLLDVVDRLEDLWKTSVINF